MPRLTAEDDSLDACSPATDEEAIRPHQFQGFKKPEYDSLHLNPGKSVLKVLWDRVSAEIAQRSGHTVQAGVKGSVKKAWSPPTTPYEEIPMSRQQLHSAEEKSTGEATWEPGNRVSNAAWEHASTDHTDVADMQAELPAMDKGRNEPEQQLTGYDHETAPSLATSEPAQEVWNRSSTAFDQKNVADVQAELPAMDKGRNEPEQQLTGYDHEMAPSLAMREAAQEVWNHRSTAFDRKNVADVQAELPAMDQDINEPEQQLTGPDHQTAPLLQESRSNTAFDRKNVADVQDDNISNTGSREEGEIEAERDNLCLDKSNPERQRQLEEDVMSTEKPQNHEPEDRIGLKTQDSASDFAPRGEQEEKVTIYDAVPKEQRAEHVCLATDPKRMVEKPKPTFQSQEHSCRLPDYLEERSLFKEQVERNQYSVFMMESQQTGMPGKELPGEVKPRHMLHEDVPSSKTMDFLSSMTDRETKRGGSQEDVVGEAGEEEEVPYLSYNPPEAAQKAGVEEAEPGTEELQETTRDEKIEALRKELETLDGYDDDDDACCAFDEESLTLRPSLVVDGRTYSMPDPVRSRLDEEALLYHVPRSPEAPRRYTDKVFFRFK